MKFESRLKELQYQFRDSGWRIHNIPWRSETRERNTLPCTPINLILMILGILIFAGGTLLTTHSFVWGMIAMMAGLSILLLGIFTMNYFFYRTLLPMDAKVVDQEIRAIEEVDNQHKPKWKTYWYARIVCEYQYAGQFWKVTPLIHSNKMFSSEAQLMKYLQDRIHKDKQCRIMINPRNPLQTVLHKKESDR